LIGGIGAAFLTVKKEMEDDHDRVAHKK
jgi:hypothetical protein